MMSRRLDVATWNIGGGVIGASHQRDAVPDLDHHVGVLTTHRPDVVCLQEAHEYDDRTGQTQELAERAGYAHWAAYALSASHLVDGARLALGMLSQYPLSGLSFRALPAPRLKAIRPAGEEWALHDKGYLVSRVGLPDGGEVHLANGHFFPLRRFGRSPADPQFAPVWRAFTDDLLELDAAGPVVAGVDLNHSPVDEVLGAAMLPGRFSSALDAHTPTTPHGAQRDYLLCGHQTRVASAGTVSTQSDHFYCHASVLV
ncbi:endonuclease/exonuclease/phosphatase family protein [Kribbella sp. NPDC051718]|uniref:endonuclease/exonuclease/phosphatase family protein n=1 Tax=Kribbella sp. NPDC051718 TaxID=3155168 RepID=UPI00342C072E